MKKPLLSLLLMSVSSLSMAATVGTLNLQGVVPAVLSITITPEPLATNLPLDTTQSNVKVAEAVEVSNSATGYTVDIVSANNGQLVNGSDTINYSLTYGGSTIDLANGDAVTGASGAVNANKDINISYTGVDYALLTQGTYSDQVTFTISAN